MIANVEVRFRTDLLDNTSPLMAEHGWKVDGFSRSTHMEVAATHPTSLNSHSDLTVAWLLEVCFDDLQVFAWAVEDCRSNLHEFPLPDSSSLGPVSTIADRSSRALGEWLSS